LQATAETIAQIHVGALYDYDREATGLLVMSQSALWGCLECSPEAAAALMRHLNTHATFLGSSLIENLKVVGHIEDAPLRHFPSWNYKVLSSSGSETGAGDFDENNLIHSASTFCKSISKLGQSMLDAVNGGVELQTLVDSLQERYGHSLPTDEKLFSIASCDKASL
jgi:hypothetical protein